jgi:NAD(P)-dependent dehydrogenase (short-subunit alcohol dehydrogenase family)
VLTVSSAHGDLDLTLTWGITARAGYSIAKAALNIVVAKYAAQYKAEGFVFLSINPGIVDTSADATSERQSLPSFLFFLDATS